MTNFVPIFPLSIVIFPGEEVNLHIFEPRYKQLVNGCFTQKKAFGIPAVINSHLKEYGCIVQITEISKTYENGEMDIKTLGLQMFRTLEVIKAVPDKLYSGAIVTYPENINNSSTTLMATLLTSMRKLHASVQTVKKFKKADQDLTVFDIAHHIGLSIAEEYELLQLTSERHRQEYLKNHFEKVVVKDTQLKALKEKIRMNGHFKTFTEFNF